MRAVTIGLNEAGQRLDKFLNKYMKEAGVSFYYKMMRKKNIVLNGKKCTGKEILLIGDEVKLFLAEETLEKFGAPPADYSGQKKATGAETKEYLLAFEKLNTIRIIYEEEDGVWGGFFCYRMVDRLFVVSINIERRCVGDLPSVGVQPSGSKHERTAVMRQKPFGNAETHRADPEPADS